MVVLFRFAESMAERASWMMSIIDVICELEVPIQLLLFLQHLPQLTVINATNEEIETCAEQRTRSDAAAGQ